MIAKDVSSLLINLNQMCKLSSCGGVEILLFKVVVQNWDVRRSGSVQKDDLSPKQRPNWL